MTTNTSAIDPARKNIRMVFLNDVRLSGRLTEDPKSRKTKRGGLVVQLNLAINQVYKASRGVWQQAATFVPVTTWNAVAEQCQKRLQKGSPLYVEGRLRSESWQTPEGRKRYGLKVDAARIRFLAKDASPLDASRPVVQ
jgi:single-strand DNA-binding protein